MLHALAAQFVNRVRKDVEPLFHHQPAVKANQHLVIADPQTAPPFERTVRGIEDVAVHAA